MKRPVLWRPVFAWCCLLISLYGTAGNAKELSAKKPADKRPNIILIMSDDMGYSDIGSYGGEISTPNLDKLAKTGLRYTQFYNSARCCPTRAALLTGLYPQQTGLGWMTASDHDLPGYQGELSQQCVTIAQVLKNGGYNTYMTGKWHVAKDALNGEKYNWPLQRGFDKFYGIILGASNYFDPATLCRNNELITPWTDAEYRSPAYYLTDAISDNSVKYLKEHDPEKPFFMYVAYTAAHWPMQAPESAIAKYKGKYDKGWESIREARFAKMKKLGIIAAGAELSPSDANPWPDEKNKPAMARRMETYAAMVETMDTGIGRIVKQLKERGMYENTVIIYLQDNGGCAENIGVGEGITAVAANASSLQPLSNDAVQYNIKPPLTREGKVVMQGLPVMAGPADTYTAYLQQWANVSNTPFRLYKHWLHEGGIATPLIIHWNKEIKSSNALRDQAGHIIDIMPTLAELAGVSYPQQYQGNKITPVSGVSLLPTFKNKPLSREAIYWEHEMNRAVRMGKWKLVATGLLSDGGYGQWKYYKTEKWELYDMEKDRSELHDLAVQHPQIVTKMAGMWERYAVATNVFPAPWKLKN